LTVFGVDPHTAKPLALTVVRDGAVAYQAKVDLRQLYDLAAGLRPDLLAVEDQYMSKNYKVAKGLSWAAGGVLGVGELLGIPTQVVNVATWKSKMGAQKGTHVVASTLRGGAADDDLASSHLIALYAEQYDGQGKPRG
jgi:Holliday junction resolvasome RuvABC endonuclease subunit